MTLAEIGEGDSLLVGPIHEVGTVETIPFGCLVGAYRFFVEEEPSEGFLPG